MKRSNRLVLLVGVFLAIVAFIGIILVLGTPKTETAKAPTEKQVVVATADIPLGTIIEANQVGTKTVAIEAADPGAFGDTSQVIGKTAREAVATGAQITSSTLNGGTSGQITNIDCPATYRCLAVQVDQISGVGTVIKTGDYVDMVVGFTGDKFPVITVSPADSSITVVAGLNSTSVKLLLQGMQVVGTLLPPPTAAGTTGGDAASPAPNSGQTTALNDQKEIVILAVTAQQAEVVKFAQLDGSMTLALRSVKDFIDPVTKQPVPPEQAATTGIILKTLVDSYGVLPPEVIQTVTPKK